MAEIEYAVNDKVFAKMKGHPVWPAKITKKVAGGKMDRYQIEFYGTHDTATVKLDQLFTFDNTTKAKYGTTRKAVFQKAMSEIVAEMGDLEIDDGNNSQDDTDGDGGDSDEAPPPAVAVAAPLPVTKRRVAKTGAAAAQKRKLEPFEKEIMQVLKEVRDKEDDQFDLFGKMVAVKLRKLEGINPRAENDLEYKLVQIIHDAEEEEEESSTPLVVNIVKAEAQGSNQDLTE